MSPVRFKTKLALPLGIAGSPLSLSGGVRTKLQNVQSLLLSCLRCFQK